MPSSSLFPSLASEFARGAPRDARRALLACALLLAGCTKPTFTSTPMHGERDDSATEGTDEDEDQGTPWQGAADSGQTAPSTPPTIDASTTSARQPVSTAQGDGATRASAMDAGVRPDAGYDAAPADVPPAWAEPLFGRYFKRSVTFAYDDAAQPPLNTRNVEYSLLTVERGDGGIELRVQLCDVSSTWVGTGAQPSSRFLLPAALPALRGRLLLEAPGKFSSNTMVQQLGFDPALGCATGRMEKRPGQSWITGTTCQCSLAPLPSAVDDCRVVDSDKDGKPGFGVLGEIPPLPPAAGVMAIDYTLTFKEGEIAVDRKHTLREERTQGAACLTGTITDVCAIGNNTLCPDGFTKLLPAAANATCAELDMKAFGDLEQSPSMRDCRTSRR